MDKFVKLGQDMVLLWSKYKVMYWAGIWNTLKLAFLATLIGCFIGLLCGVLNTIPYTKKDPLPKRFLLKLLRIIIRIYVEVFRGTPMVLQSVFIYYGLPYFSNNALRFDNIFAAALLIVAINTGAYMAESVRGGIISIDPGQTEGQGHRHDPFPDHGERHHAPGPAEHHAPNRQQLHHQREGHLRHVHHRLYGVLRPAPLHRGRQ